MSRVPNKVSAQKNVNEKFKLTKYGGRFTMNVKRTKSNGKMTEAAINIASTGLPLVGLSIIKPQRKPQEECDSES
jgi:hypothetical protein